MARRRVGLAERRKIVGLSQEKLAEAVRVDPMTVKRWEAGEYTPQPGQRPLLAKALAVSVEELHALLTMADIAEHAADLAVHGQTPSGLLTDSPKHGASAVHGSPESALTWPGGVDVSPPGEQLSYLLRQLDTSASGGDEWASPRRREVAYTQLVQFLVRWAHTVNRRDMLRMLGWAAAAAAGAPELDDLDEQETERLMRAIQAPQRVDHQVIDHIEGVLWRCRRQDDTLGPQAVLDTVLAQRSLVRSLLPDAPDTVRDRLRSVYGDLSRHAGWLSFDLNHHDAATDYYELARAAAHEANNTELAAFVLCNMSHLATWRGQARTGIDHAVAAQGWASRTDDHRLQVWAWDRAALALARDGQRAAAMAAMEQGRLLMTRADTERPSLAYFLDGHRTLPSESTCHLYLGDFMAGAAAAENDLAGLDPSFVRHRALVTLRLGVCRLRSPKPDVVGAAQAIGEAGGLAVRYRSARLIDRLRRGVAELEPWQDVPEVKNVRHELAAHGLV